MRSLEPLYKILRNEFFDQKTSRFYICPLSTGVVDIVIPKSKEYKKGILLTLQKERSLNYLEMNELLHSEIVERHVSHKNFQNVMIVYELYIDFLKHLLKSPRISLFMDYSDKIITSFFIIPCMRS